MRHRRSDGLKLFSGSTVDTITNEGHEMLKDNMFQLLSSFPLGSIILQRLISEIILPLLFLIHPGLTERQHTLKMTEQEFGFDASVRVRRYFVDGVIVACDLLYDESPEAFGKMPLMENGEKLPEKKLRS